MGSLGTITFLLASVLGGGAIGSWACGSSTVRRCVASVQVVAHGVHSQFSLVLGLGDRRRCCSSGGCSVARSHDLILAVVGAPGWVGMRSFGPRPYRRPLPCTPNADHPCRHPRDGRSTGCGGRPQGARHELLWALGAMSAAGATYGAWSLIKPSALGFGDVRMACLVALGVGACSPSVAMVVISCAPFAAGLGGRYRAARPRPTRSPHRGARAPTGDNCQRRRLPGEQTGPGPCRGTAHAPWPFPRHGRDNGGGRQCGLSGPP